MAVKIFKDKEDFDQRVDKDLNGVTQEFLNNRHSLDIRIIGLADIDKMIFNLEGIDISNWEKIFSKATTKTQIKEFVNKMIKLNLSNSIFIDCTASDDVASCYEKIINASISIVTPNKRASSGPYNYLQSLRN